MSEPVLPVRQTSIEPVEPRASSIEGRGQTYTAWFTAYPKTHEKRGQTVEVITAAHYVAALAAARADSERYRQALLTWADNVERDRREPDKMLCAVQSMRRAARDA